MIQEGAAKCFKELPPRRNPHLEKQITYRVGVKLILATGGERDRRTLVHKTGYSTVHQWSFTDKSQLKCE